MTIFSRKITVKKTPPIIWAHGWGQSHESFVPLADSLKRSGQHILIDLPGFGKSPQPDEDWDTASYADAIAGWLKAEGYDEILWVGHSFGCRIGIQLAARHPEIMKAMVLISAAGLKRKRPAQQSLWMICRVGLYKVLKKLVPLGLVSEDWLKNKFGSADYRNAGAMRSIFLKTIHEDLSDTARQVTCPVRLIYGDDDQETPIEFGERYAELMPKGSLFILKNQDHYSLLGAGRHAVAVLLQEFFQTSEKFFHDKSLDKKDA